MAFRITNATAQVPDTITVFFSADADKRSAETVGSYTIKAVDPSLGASSFVIDSVNYDQAQIAATITLNTDSGDSLQQGQWIELQITSGTVTPAAGGPAITNGGTGNNTFYVHVNGNGNPLGSIAQNTGNIAAGVQSAAGTVGDIAAFPVLTEEIGYPPSPLAAPRGGPSMAPIGTSLGQIATKAITDVLGWKLKADDPKGFVGALTASFTCKEMEGHTECTWVPRSYAVQTDLSGGITGAQASIYSRAKDALDQSLPLLDGLYALDPEADKEDVAALKGVARSQLTELVNELGMLGGPRVSRVNQYFGLLVLSPGTTFPPANLPTDPDQIGGTLGNLRDILGLNFTTQDFVNTVDDEQDLSNFRILSDYVTSLAQSWINNLAFFGLDISKPFYGTQLVLLSRQLSVIAESIDEVRFALDSVFIGPAERQTLELRFAAADPPLFIEDLLSWIQGFAAEEGPRLIQDGGKFGVENTFVPVAQQLRHLVDAARDPNPANAGLPRGFHTARVQRALEELDDELEELVNLATPITHVIVDEPPPATLQQMVDQLRILTAEVTSLKKPAATLVVFPDTLTFGSQPTGTTSSPQPVAVVNFGNTAFVGSVTITITGADAGDFAQTNTCSGGPLKAGAACTVLVTFTPTGTGARAATLTITANGQSKSVSLSGTGIAP